jgi:hypothetical protein
MDMPYSLVFALVETNAVSVSIELACGHCYVYGSWRLVEHKFVCAVNRGFLCNLINLIQ